MTLSANSVNAINFKAFNALNKIIQNIECTALASKIIYHQRYSKLKKNNRACIMGTYEEIGDWFNFGAKKAKRLLGLARKKGILTVEVGTFRGKKTNFITAVMPDTNPINDQMLQVLIQETGSLRNSLIFSGIAFRFSGTKIVHDDKRWCCISRAKIAGWAGICLQTFDTKIKLLAAKGLIEKKNFGWNGTLKTHFHISNPTIEALNLKKENLKTQVAEERTARNTKKIAEEDSTKTEMSKPADSTGVPNSQPNAQDSISFIGDTLSMRQLKYLESALEKTVAQNQLQISSPVQLFEELKFSILEPLQHKDISCFKHVVSRNMRILACRNWRTPKGFYKFSESGVQIKKQKDIEEAEYQRLKQEERDGSAARRMFEGLKKWQEQQRENATSAEAEDTASEQVENLGENSYGTRHQVQSVKPKERRSGGLKSAANILENIGLKAPETMPQ